MYTPLCRTLGLFCLLFALAFAHSDSHVASKTEDITDENVILGGVTLGFVAGTVLGFIVVILGWIITTYWWPRNSRGAIRSGAIPGTLAVAGGVANE